MSEYEHKTPTKAGDVMLVPIGIGHCIENCSKDFRRLVIYSKQRLNVLVNPAMHLYESKFEIEGNRSQASPMARRSRRDVRLSSPSVEWLGYRICVTLPLKGHCAGEGTCGELRDNRNGLCLAECESRRTA